MPAVTQIDVVVNGCCADMRQERKEMAIERRHTHLSRVVLLWDTQPEMLQRRTNRPQVAVDGLHFPERYRAQVEVHQIDILVGVEPDQDAYFGVVAGQFNRPQGRRKLWIGWGRNEAEGAYMITTATEKQPFQSAKSAYYVEGLRE